ncbi:MAG: MarR family transcriptional regulator [Pseudohongiellaceae bacterium]|nr:MarR family transcriptional regulator [Pseudohongiellaceae bacterium]
MKTPIEQSLGFSIHDVARLLRYSFDRQSQKIGMSRALWSVLAHLHREDGMQQSVLARAMDITPITLARHLDKLEKEGWIERRSDPSDRRVKHIFLKAKADPVIEQLTELSQDIKSQALQGISRKEEKLFMDVLSRMRENLNTSDSPHR